MIWLFASILTSVINFLLFRQFERWRVDTLTAVATNYLACICLGWFIQGDLPMVSKHTPWLPWAFFIGLLFISMFVIIGLSARMLGVNMTTIASKMSFVIPMTLAYGLYQTSFHPTQAFALVFAILAIWLYAAPATQNQIGWKRFLPFAIFLGGGLADSALNYTEVKLLPHHEQGVFLMVLFGTSGLFGWSALGIKALQGDFKQELRHYFAGLLLGISNFCTVYFLLQAFSSKMRGAFIYPLLNVGTIVLAAAASWWLFAEKPNNRQKWALVSAILAILMYSWQA
jgi:drug/metabolite transporter (DMT)-like permease